MFVEFFKSKFSDSIMSCFTHHIYILNIALLNINTNVDNLSRGFGITFFISISFIAAIFSASELWWDRDDAGNVAILSPLSTSTVATFISLSPPIGSLKFQLKFSNRCLGIVTNFLSPLYNTNVLCNFSFYDFLNDFWISLNTFREFLILSQFVYV